MTTFTQEQYNFAHLVMYVGKNGPRVLKKYLVDNLFRYQLLKNEVHLLENLDPSKFSLIFPANEPVSSLDKLDDAVVLDVSKLVFNTEDINDTQALRRCLYAELEKPILCTFMQNNEAKFRKKNKRCKLLSRKQMDILFPPGDSINIDKLDITAVCFILFEGFNFMKPITDLDKFPADSDISPGSDILRIKLCRNRLAHNPDDEIGDGDFDTLWEYMTTAFGRLTGDVNYRQEGDRLKCVRPHMDIMDRLQSILEKWHKEDREERSDHLENITEKVACFKEHTENVIRDSTKCIISAVKKYAKHKPHKGNFIFNT
ncbi:uncharacterized protein LOC110446787 [Mizuhopecten yessoensis]|uniref:uncharacterized protein LOC110446787 n=1 Tax=Mizuhopecten yessoensis TaxID=6573 RepID=UPI000B45EBFB|nr:uncharacterized protein LOC110446787 [Mizuhopecten yessoensis]